MILLPAGLGIYSINTITSEYWLLKLSASSPIFTMTGNDCKIKSDNTFVLSSNNGNTLFTVDNTGVVLDIKYNNYTSFLGLVRKTDSIITSVSGGGISLDSILNANNFESVTGTTGAFLNYDGNGNKYFAFKQGSLFYLVSFNNSNVLRWARSISAQSGFTFDSIISLKVSTFIVIEYSRHSSAVPNKCFAAFDTNGMLYYIKYVNANNVTIVANPTEELASCVVNYKTAATSQTGRTTPGGISQSFLNDSTNYLCSDPSLNTYLLDSQAIVKKYLYDTRSSVSWRKILSLINNGVVAEVKGTYLIILIITNTTTAYVLKYPVAGNIDGTFGDLTISGGGGFTAASAATLFNSQDTVNVDTTNWTVTNSTPIQTGVINGVTQSLNNVN